MPQGTAPDSPPPTSPLERWACPSSEASHLESRCFEARGAFTGRCLLIFSKLFKVKFLVMRKTQGEEYEDPDLFFLCSFSRNSRGVLLKKKQDGGVFNKKLTVCSG